MALPETLLELAGADRTPATWHTAALILIDMQNEYLQGPIAVVNSCRALDSARRLLADARVHGAPVFHVAHRGKAGGLFDRDAPRGQIIDTVAPHPGEAVVEKSLPNSFAATDLDGRLKATGRRELVMIGFMTHMCVSSTARAALDLGYRVTINAAACATRDLPDGAGAAIPAALVHRVALAELADRFAIVVHEAVVHEA